jgi:hypothetical protein
LLFFAVFISLIISEAILRIRSQILKTRVSHIRSSEVDYCYQENSYGFRDNEFKKKKLKDTLRIFLIGDSFVEGGSVDEKYTFDKLLENKFREDGLNCEVYNLGIRGTGPSGYWLVAKQLKDFHPDLIIVSVYVDNDIEKTYYFKNGLEKILHWIRQKSKLLNLINKMLENKKIYTEAKGYPIDDFYKELMLSGKINPYLMRNKADIHGFYNYLVQLFYDDPAFRYHIFAIKQLYKNIPFLLLINPSKYQVNVRYVDSLKKLGFVLNENKVVDRKIQDAIVSWAVRKQINCLDILPYMIEKQSELFFHEIDDHYNVLGNKFVVDKLYDKLKQIGIKQE